MSDKCYSLIHEGDIHIAPGKKRIPAGEFSALLSGEELLQKVEEDIAQYRREVEEECNQLKKQAREEGFTKGYEEWTEKLAEIERKIEKVRQEMMKTLLPITVKAAKKIVGKELETHPETIVNIVEKSLKSIAGYKRITIHVHKDELRRVQKEKPRLKTLFERLESLAIVASEDVGAGGCIIETEGGILNAQLENQWMILENALQKIWEQGVPPQVPEEPQSEAVEQTKEEEESPPSVPEETPEKKVQKEAVPEEEEDWGEEDEWEDEWEDEEWEDEE